MAQRNLFTSGSGFDVVGVLELGTSGLGITSGAADERPDDATEVLRNSAFAYQFLDVAVPLLVGGFPVGHQAAPQTPLVLFTVARIAGSHRLLFALARSCTYSQSALIICVT